MKLNHPFAILLGAALMLSPIVGVAQVTVDSSGSIVNGQPKSAIPAGDRATNEQLAKLFEVMRLRDQMVSMRKIVPAMVEGQMREQMRAMSSQLSPDSDQLTPTQRAALNQLLSKYIDRAVNLYSVDEMVADMTGLYREHLTREDIDAMIVFYGSPAGQHLLDAQPKIAQEYMPLVMQRAAERTKTLTAEMMKDVAALKQSSNAAPAQPKK
jgi:hypothetical protein